MFELWTYVERVLGTCTSDVPMIPGRRLLVRNGRLFFPGGGPVCIYALQSILPLLPLKERISNEEKNSDWLWRVHEAQCPDPKGRVIWRIEQRPLQHAPLPPATVPTPAHGDLRVTVTAVQGTCTAGMRAGHYALVRGSSLYLPQPFCLYALQAVLPQLPARQRPLLPDDWMVSENEVICPDPEGNVIMCIDRVTDV